MSATWCWPHELKQPLALMCRCFGVRIAVDARRAQLLAQLRRQRARRRDAELARVRAGAGADVADRARAGRGQVDRLQRRRRRRAGRPRSPSAAACSGRRWCASCRPCTCARRRPARAPGRSVRSPSGSVMVAIDVAGLPLRDDVGRAPVGEASGCGPARQRPRRAQRLLVGRVQVGQERRPARIGAQLGALFQHQPLGLLDAQLLDHELEAARFARFVLLAQAREHAADRLRDRQQLLLGQELVEQPAPPAARRPGRRRLELEAAHGLAVHLARARDGADVVEVGQAARVLPGSPRTRP